MKAAERSLDRILAQENVAGKAWSQIKYIFSQIVNCVSHLHDQGILHADLKPLNIMRTTLGNMVLIDLDASIDLTGTMCLEGKVSSAFCPPEWAAMASQQAPLDNSLMPGVSFDVWALGAILFHMTAGEPLFLSDQANNIDSANLNILCNWDDEYKQSKLQKIVDTQARNLVARLLNKVPSMRPSLSAVLSHPFLSGRPSKRMVGDEASFDVFISYRVSSDSKHAQLLYDKLTADGLRVWYDKACLLPGKNWEEGFCDGLVSSRAFVCLLSKGGLAHPTNMRQNFSQLTTASSCDNVLLEHQLAVEMLEMGMLDYIFPVFIGEENIARSTTGSVIYDSFDFSVLGNMPKFSIPSVDSKLIGHLDRQCLGVPLVPHRSVNETVQTVTSCQGGFVAGQQSEAFNVVVDSIRAMFVQTRPTSTVSQRVTQVNDLQSQIQGMISRDSSVADIDNAIRQFMTSLRIA
jgi:serine/threonine protein kinase